MEPDFNVTFVTSSDFKLDYTPNDRLNFVRIESI